MDGWRLYRLPRAVKVVVTLYILTIGVGLLFALVQVRNREGKRITYDAVVRHFYGPPAARDSIDQYWTSVETALVKRYDSGDRGLSPRSAAAATGALSLDDLDSFGAPVADKTPSAGEHADLLAKARSVDGLRALISEQHDADLSAELGIQTSAQLVSLGHTHTFGRAAFLLPISFVILMTWLPWGWKGAFAVIPLIGVVIDYPAQLLTRFVAPEFAWFILLAGGLMAVGYILGFALGLWELWIRRT